MEVPFTQEVGSHAVSLLASLNLQRQQAQFCDCVVTQTQSPAHFYLAHRCILAASSPVLASLLLSSGALLELQAPCLSDSVLEVLLDYIYTGTLHLPAGQQEYCSLLTAATHLHMEELHHALRDRQCDELNSDNTVTCTMARNQLHSENIDTHIKPEHTWYKIWNKPRSANVDSCVKLAETNTSCSCGSSSSSRSSNSIPVSSVNNMNICRGKHVNSLMEGDRLYYSPRVEVVRDPQRSREEEGPMRREEKMERLYLPSTNDAQEEVQRCREKNGTQLDSLGSVELEEALRSRKEEGEEEEERMCSPRCSSTQGDFLGSPSLPLSISLPPICPSPHHYRGDPSPSHTTSSSPPSCETVPVICPSPHHYRGDPSPSHTSSSSPPSCETVPVICHSGRATLTPTLRPLCPAAQPSLLASSTIITRPPVPQPASPAEGIPSNNSKDINKDHWGAQNLGLKNNHSGIQNRNYIDTDSDRCGMQNKYYKVNKDSDGRKCGLSLMTECKDHLIPSGSFQEDNNTTHPNDDGTPQTQDYRDYPDTVYRDDKEWKMDLGFEFPTDRRPVDCSITQDAFMATAEDEMARHTQGQRLGSERAVMSHPVLCSNMGRECHHNNHCLNSEWEREEEGEGHSRLYRDEIDRMDSCSSQHRAIIDRMDSASSLCGVMVDGENGSSVLHRADIDRRDSYCSLHRAMTDRTDGIDNCLPVQMASTTLKSTLDDVMARGHVRAFDEPEREEEPIKPHPSLEFKISDSENAQPNAPFAVSVHNKMHDPAYNIEGHLYYGHLRYQCLSRAHTPSCIHPEHTHSPPQHSDHLPPDQPDYSNDWEGTDACSSQYHSPLRHHCTNSTGTQLLLLDINSKLVPSIGPQRACAGGGERGVVFGGEDGAGEKGVWTMGVAEETETTATFEARADGSESEAECGSEAEVGSVVGEGKRGANSGTVSKVEGVSLTTSLPVCLPTSVPASCVPTSLTVSSCIQSVVHQPYQCTMCERSFSQRGSLNRHMRSHLGVRPYPCPQCPMTFSRQYRVTEHMRVHQRTMVEDPQRLPAPPT